MIREALDHYNVSGKMRLYHYSQSEDDKLTLDPDYFLSRRSSFTRNDFSASDVPRVFFYTNLDHAENIVKQGRSLYTAFVDISKIYDLTKDPEGLLKVAKRWPTNMHGEPIKNSPAPMDIDLLLRSLAGKSRPSTKLLPLKNEKEHYSGVFYNTGTMDIIIWFEPIEVHKFNPENVNSPADTKEEI